MRNDGMRMVVVPEPTRIRVEVYDRDVNPTDKAEIQIASLDGKMLTRCPSHFLSTASVVPEYRARAFFELSEFRPPLAPGKYKALVFVRSRQDSQEFEIQEASVSTEA